MPGSFRRGAAFVAIAILSACSKSAPPAGTAAAYAPARSCAGCHAAQWNTFRHTGMGQSFFKPTPERMIEDWDGANTLHHVPSDRHYKLTRRDGRYFLRRHQIGYGGKETAVMEAEIHYVLGSGNHARSYLHRTKQNRLIELPVGWYPDPAGRQKQGFFAMSPGYDRPAHQGFRRKISFDCMFCHNAYPKVDASAAEPLFAGDLPEGIDCQRCHGPAAAHVAAAGRGREEARRTILNPAKLDAARSMEVCMQCHLETTSFALPNSIQRHDRPPFSYRPDEPLSNFVFHFDHAPNTGNDEKFEIVNSVYRLRKSACFLQSKGNLGCITCHNPHESSSGEAAATRYRKACVGCHATEKLSAARGHNEQGGCVSCHMPKRRTEDVIHAVMTDHRILRRPPPDPLAPRKEKDDAYRGEVVPYYPAAIADSADRDLYTSAAQVMQKSNLAAGADRLEQALRTHAPKAPEFYFVAAQARFAQQRFHDAIRLYEEASRRDANYLPAQRTLGAVLLDRGQGARALSVLEAARAKFPDDATTNHELGRAYRDAGRLDEAIAAVRNAVRLDPEFPEAHNSLGGMLFEKGDRAGAEAAFLESLRHQPDFAEAHSNLGNFHAASGDAAQAEYHFKLAIGFNPRLVSARFNYGGMLASLGRFGPAEEQIREAVKLSPASAPPREMLGNLLARRGDWRAAAVEYREALKSQPRFARAMLGLGTAILATGQIAEARQRLTEAASMGDGAVRQEAMELLSEVERGR